MADPYNAAFQHWKSVRSQLEQAVHEFAAICSSLGATLNTTPALPAHRDSQARIFAELDLELPSLTLLEQSLTKCRSSLQTIRNSSSTLAPVNSLPSEILLIIFNLANRDWINKDYIKLESKTETSVYTLTNVCSLWRRVILGSTHFWCQLELVLNGSSSASSYKIAELSVERSKNSLLDVSMSESKKISEYQAQVTNWDISRAVAFLIPLMRRVRGLKVHSDTEAADKIFGDIIACWAKNGTTGIAESFDVRLDEGFLGTSLPISDSDLSPNDFMTFLTSLRTLRLRNASIDFKSFPCTGLQELHLQYIPGWNPTTSDIATILSANPRLRSLALIDLPILLDMSPASDPIALNKLEVLTLEAAISANLWAVLLLIKSSSSAIRLSLSLGDDPQYISAMQKFSQRCNVTVLHLQAEDPNDFDILAILMPMPHLHTALLRYFSLTGDTLHEYIHQRSSDLVPPGLWPQLRNLSLISCNPPPDFVRQLASLLLPSQKLSIYDDLNPGAGLILENERYELDNVFSDMGIELVWMDETGESDPTARWTFVHNS